MSFRRSSMFLPVGGVAFLALYTGARPGSSWFSIVVLLLIPAGVVLTVAAAELFALRRETLAPIAQPRPAPTRRCGNADCGCGNPAEAHFCRRCGRTLEAPAGLAAAG